MFQAEADTDRLYRTRFEQDSENPSILAAVCKCAHPVVNWEIIKDGGKKIHDFFSNHLACGGISVGLEKSS